MSDFFKIQSVKPGVVLLGFIAFITQVILLREFLTFFNGNELIIGIILANWMLLTALGAYLGRFIKKYKNQEQLTLALLGSLAFLPIITVLALHFFSILFFQTGVMVGITEVFLYSLGILSPFCIVSGMLFTLFANQESLYKNQNRIGIVYSWESTGSMIGGFVLNFILIWFFSTFESLYVVMALVVVITVFLSVKKEHYFISGVLTFIFVLFNFLYLQNNFDKSIREYSFPGQAIQYIDETPYGVLVITSHAGQTNYFENNVLLASSGDAISREESAHFAMVQHKNPEKVLVFSGIISGVLDEIAKYPVKKIDYVDINPGIIKIARENIEDDSTTVIHLIKNDAIRYLKTTTEKYDVVIFNLPKPTTIQFNRFYTKEFFVLLKQNLDEGAVICLSLPSSSNYLNDEAQKLLSIVYSTLNTEFKHILILPGADDYILASDKELNGRIAHEIESKKISTEYVNNFYFDDDLLMNRSNKIMSQINVKAPVNTNFNPVCYQSQIKLWLSFFNVRYWIPAIFILLFAGFFYIKANPINKGVFAVGFAGTSIEFVLLLVLQVIYGYVFVAAGICIMVFMGGLALGSIYSQRIFKNITIGLFGKLQILVAVFAFLLPFVFLLFTSIELPEIVILTVFFFLLFIISFLSGVIFSMATILSKKNIVQTASDAYGLDLLGAAAGALLFAIYLVPMLGFGLSLVVTGLFNILTAILIFKSK